ncbi:Uncharacterised protein [uncultured archaeon]|nr:Uncharacterised protein [uncultured archaeon]
MSEIALASINSFGSKPPKDDFVPPAEEQILEIPISEFNAVLEDLVSIYNQIAEAVRDAGLVRGRELARLTEDHARVLKAEKSPTVKLMLLNAFIKRLFLKIREALKSRPEEGGKVIQVCSKIMARAVQIIDYIKTTIQDDPFRRKEISFDSKQARILFSGAGGEPVSRRDTIRAMRKAERLWPALNCGHRPNDGRQTTRLIGKTEDLKDSPIIGYRDLWQRSDRKVGMSL